MTCLAGFPSLIFPTYTAQGKIKFFNNLIPSFFIAFLVLLFGKYSSGVEKCSD